MTTSTTLGSVHKRQLASYWIRWEVLGIKTRNLPSSLLDELERDGRKRNKVINNLTSEGYLNLIDGKVELTKKAYNEVKAERPDLAAMVERSWDPPSGATWSLLPLETQKYILEHQDEYTVFSESEYSDKTQTPLKFGETFPQKAKYHRIMVKDAAFSEAREKAVFAKELESSRRRNVRWGLEQLGIATEEESSCLKSKDSSPFSTNVLKDNPEDWSKDFDSEIQRAQKKMEDLQKHLEDLKKLQTKMTEYGGWDKFLEDYTRVLTEELKKEANN